MSYRFRSFVPVLTGVLLAVTAAGTGADDYLNRAAAHYRDKDYAAAYSAAGNSADLTYRGMVRGMAAFRQERFEEALPHLAEAEQKVPLLADYAMFYQAEALLKLKRYAAATAKVTQLQSAFPSSKLSRRTEKLAADILYEGGEYKGALKLYQAYIEKNPTGSDAVNANYHLGRCREELADLSGAAQLYRTVWLNNPVSSFAGKAQERLKNLERAGVKNAPYSGDELLKRASAQYNQNEYSACVKTLEMIPLAAQSQAVIDRLELRTGMALYRLRQYKSAEKHFARITSSSLSGVRSEARFWLAKSLDRQDQKERALTLYLELAGEGKKQEFADDALLEAAGVKRGLGQYAEAARLYEKAAKLTIDAKVASKATWDTGWSRYLAGEYAAAADIFKGLLGDDAHREKALYWLAKALEKSGDVAAVGYFKTVQDEFPAGFYATWYREQKGVKDTREALGSRDAVAELPVPSGYEKPRLLALLGMQEEARTEIAAIRKKNGDKKSAFPALARIYLEIRDFSSAIALFMQNRPVAWERATLPLWTAGYPRAYTELVSQNAALNGLSEGLVYALIRAESGFSPTIKSSAGAIGLMQMMPATAKLTAREKGEFNPQKLTTPEYNVRLGTRHLHDLMKEYNGDVVYMAAAYNAGAAALERWKKGYKGLAKDEFIESIPYLETRDYVKKVYASAATYRQLYGLK